MASVGGFGSTLWTSVEHEWRIGGARPRIQLLTHMMLCWFPLLNTTHGELVSAYCVPSTPLLFHTIWLCTLLCRWAPWRRSENPTCVGDIYHYTIHFFSPQRPTFPSGVFFWAEPPLPTSVLCRCDGVEFSTFEKLKMKVVSLGCGILD